MEATVKERRQCMDALARANEVRLAAAAVKRDVAGGRLTVGQALRDDRSRPLKIFDLLIAQPRWGRRAALRVLGPRRISETRRVAELTERQVAELAELLG